MKMEIYRWVKSREQNETEQNLTATEKNQPRKYTQKSRIFFFFGKKIPNFFRFQSAELKNSTAKTDLSSKSLSFDLTFVRCL